MRRAGVPDIIEARVEFDHTKISADQLAAAVDRLGSRAKVVSVLPAPR